MFFFSFLFFFSVYILTSWNCALLFVINSGKSWPLLILSFLWSYFSSFSSSYAYTISFLGFFLVSFILFFFFIIPPCLYFSLESFCCRSLSTLSLSLIVSGSLMQSSKAAFISVISKISLGIFSQCFHYLITFCSCMFSMFH